MVDYALTIIGVAVTFAVNIAAGYWRAHAKSRGSRFEWFLAVHAPVPLVAVLRRLAGVGFSVQTAPVLALFILAYFAGQRVGGLVHGGVAARIGSTSRLIVADILRLRMLGKN